MKHKGTPWVWRFGIVAWIKAEAWEQAQQVSSNAVIHTNDGYWVSLHGRLFLRVKHEGEIDFYA